VYAKYTRECPPRGFRVRMLGLSFNSHGPIHPIFFSKE
jgi:hypothetical protein